MATIYVYMLNYTLSTSPTLNLYACMCLKQIENKFFYLHFLYEIYFFLEFKEKKKIIK